MSWFIFLFISINFSLYIYHGSSLFLAFFFLSILNFSFFLLSWFIFLNHSFLFSLSSFIIYLGLLIIYLFFFSIIYLNLPLYHFCWCLSLFIIYLGSSLSFFSGFILVYLSFALILSFIFLHLFSTKSSFLLFSALVLPFSIFSLIFTLSSNAGNSLISFYAFFFYPPLLLPSIFRFTLKNYSSSAAGNSIEFTIQIL